MSFRYFYWLLAEIPKPLYRQPTPRALGKALSKVACCLSVPLSIDLRASAANAGSSRSFTGSSGPCQALRQHCTRHPPRRGYSLQAGPSVLLKAPALIHIGVRRVKEA